VIGDGKRVFFGVGVAVAELSDPRASLPKHVFGNRQNDSDKSGDPETLKRGSEFGEKLIGRCRAILGFLGK